MTVRSLKGITLVLAATALVEIGYLWGTAGAPAAPDITFCQHDLAPAPAAAIPAPPPSAVLATADPPAAASPAPRRPRPAPRKATRAEVDAREMAECARSGGPLCGIPP